MALDELARVSTAQVVLTWAKPNDKTEGIVISNLLAQQATTLPPREEEPVTPTPKSFVKHYINNVQTHKWNARWTSGS